VDTYVRHVAVTVKNTFLLRCSQSALMYVSVGLHSRFCSKI